jgi:formylglycine-generating enzyme required for sulfatase activity
MRDRLETRTCLAIGWTVALAAGGARAQDRGTLVIHTDPDSAVVVLDGAKDPEPQRTPYTNENMVPGTHSILLRPANPAYMSAVYTANVDPGRTSVVEHSFEYRTKATGMDLLSLAPWKMDAEFGIGYAQYVDSSTGGPYPAGKQPSSVDLPLQLRFGFPYGLETHVTIPLAERSDPGISSSMALGDVGLGAKWTYAPLNSAVDVSYTLGSAKMENLGELSDALTLTLITSQRFQMFDLAGNLGYSLRFNSMAPGNLTPGDAAFARLRGGVIFFDQLLPYLQVSLDYRFPTTAGSTTVDSASYLATATPGVIWYAGRNLALEVGVPLGLVASHQETHWGLQASVAWEFGLGSQPAHPASAKAAPVSAYPLQPVGVPQSAPSHLLFASRDVTNGDYKAFCDKTGHEYPADPEFAALPNYFSDPQYADYPVVNVSIADARAYATWVGKRLPTVGEWRREVENLNLSGSQVACGLDAPEPVSSRAQGIGFFNMVGDVAEWVENDRSSGSVAYIAGGFFSLPRERCLDKGRWIDVASPAGAKYIGFRLVTEVK